MSKNNTSTAPNILFIVAESMDGRRMGCMGDRSLRRATPSLDGLAENGTLFTNAYSVCPVCNPARASFWSGKYPDYHSCWNNHEGLKPDVPTFRDTFDRAGYRTGAIGPIDYAYGLHSIRDRIGSWTRAANIERPTCRTPLPEILDETPHGRDWELCYRAVDWLHEASRSDRPFMLYFTTGLVHPAFRALRSYMDLVDADALEIPPTLGGLDLHCHPVDRYMRITKNCDKAFSEPLVRRMRHVYAAMIAELDAVVGRLLSTLEELGLRESTYVIFTSDHGEMAGEQNQVLKRTMYEPSIHVPMIVTGPDVRRGGTEKCPVSLIDLYPTLLNMAGLDYQDFSNYPDTLDGESILPLATGAGTDGRARDWAFAEYNGDRCNTGTYMLRRDHWKYIHYEGYDPQLFDIEADPWEEHNSAPANPDVCKKMHDTLIQNFDCAGIDARAKQYDRESFIPWREARKKDGTYAEIMSHVYSGYDRQCIEDLRPWTAEDEAKIEAWLEE